MITLDLRHAIACVVTAEGFGGDATAADPGLRPGGRPGEYASSVAFALARGTAPAAGTHAAGTRGTAIGIAGRLGACLEERYDWIAQAKATGPGYLTVTVTTEAIVSLAARIATAGPDCVRSDALAGLVLPGPDLAPWESAGTWARARDLLAGQITARLAVAAGASIEGGPGGGTGAGSADRSGEDDGCPGRTRGRSTEEVAAAVAFAGADAVLFSLATVMPGRSVRIDLGKITRHHEGNPAYAVRYAHARAASGVRWAAALGTGEAGPQRPPADPGELTLLDALSWLPERVAIAARRGRPDEFARFAQRLAALTLATVTIPTSGRAPGSDRLALAKAARAGIAASLGLLGVHAPDRL